ncbi:MAG: hypothetical protein KAS18_01190 [Calditrichia bacterium]|nr:hypothetical protein [Calditrichia bacterium]
MKNFQFILSAIISILLLHCGSPDFEAEAEKAMQNANYSEALKLWEKAKQQENYDESNNQKIALAYMLKGQELYNKTRNVRSFVGNFEIGQSFIPEETTPEFKKQYSQILFSLGKAYNTAKPKNTVEKEDFFSLSINRLKEALLQDSTNSEADQLLTEIKQNYFQGLIDKGKESYKKGVRTGNVNLYFTAEYYLKQAMEFESANKEILSYLKKVEAKTLSVLNYRDGLAMAVLKQEYQKDDLLIYVVIKNYLAESVSLKLSNFKLVDKTGESHSIYSKGMKVQELFGGRVLSDSTLAPNQPEIDGLLVFNLPEKPKLHYLSYQIKKNKESKKYFP